MERGWGRAGGAPPDWDPPVQAPTTSLVPLVIASLVLGVCSSKLPCPLLGWLVPAQREELPQQPGPSSSYRGTAGTSRDSKLPAESRWRLVCLSVRWGALLPLRADPMADARSVCAVQHAQESRGDLPISRAAFLLPLTDSEVIL